MSSSQPPQTFAERLGGCLGAIVLMVVILGLVGMCLGPDTQSVNTVDYVKKNGLPPDPYDRTPPANR